MSKAPFAISAMLISALSLGNLVLAQENSSQFTPENAVLNTSIPFAIGAREARQELRGAFGWSTFQEGLVDGVYFRFDPDGYARFSPTPRLDSNVFEVICRPRTTSCMGRKGTLSLYLSGDGSLQMRLQDFAPGDTLHLTDGLTDLPLPEQAMTDLDSRLETLLSSGGDLVIKRGEQQVSSTSLAGFGPVATYLRWITAQQDYAILPRDWPVPNTEPLVATTLTQTPTRQSLVALPQSQPVFEIEAQQIAPAESEIQIAEVRGELNALRDLLATRNEPELESIDSVTFENSLEVLTPAEQLPRNNTLEARVEALEYRLQEIEKSVLDIEKWASAQTSLKGDQQIASMHYSAQEEDFAANNGTDRIVTQMDYLITEIGLDPETAFMLIRKGTLNGRDVSPMKEDETPEPASVIADILEELQSQLPTLTPTAEPANNPEVLKVTDASVASQSQQDQSSMHSGEYQVLTDYFQSVFGG